MSALTDRIAEVQRAHQPEYLADKYGNDVCSRGCGWRAGIGSNNPDWAAHVAEQIEAELGFTEDQYTTQEIGVSPVTLHHWRRWISPWTEKK